jgi:hypothetical protein
LSAANNGHLSDIGSIEITVLEKTQSTAIEISLDYRPAHKTPKRIKLEISFVMRQIVNMIH